MYQKDRDGVGDWYYKNLLPIFTSILNELEASDVDEIFHPITHIFLKNTVSLLECIKKYLGSYCVAQEMRLLIEFVADMNFLIKNPKNIPRLKKDANKYRKKLMDEKKTWEETIVLSGNMHLFDDITGEEVYTTARAKKVFGKKIYDFYCAYAHFNLYAICDDDENVTRLRDYNKTNYQKVALLKYYPDILDKFVSTIKTIVEDDDRINYDSIEFRKEFDALLYAILNAKVKKA